MRIIDGNGAQLYGPYTLSANGAESATIAVLVSDTTGKKGELMSLELWLAYVVAAGILIAIPGPTNFMVMGVV